MNADGREAGRGRSRRDAFIPVLLWDTAWKALAIRRAIARRDYRWIAGIALSNTAGLVPMYYLWRTRNR